MFGKVIGSLACAAVLGCSSQANAVTFHMTGTVTDGSGTDGLINVGDTVTLDVTVANQFIVQPVGPGDSYVGTYPGGLSIHLNGYAWSARDEELDGEDRPYCVGVYCSSAPFVYFHGNQITGVFADDPLLPTFSPVPAFGLEGATFSIFNTDLYGNTSTPQGFRGVWDLADAVVTGVPEPSTWAMLLLGLLGVGAMLRRRRRPARLAQISA